jgi:copper(I)-binding protein
MTLAAPRHRLPAHWALALAGAIAFALMASDASALFIVNQPWVRPARKAQTTNAYMNLTSTDGATLLAARSEDAGRIALRSARSTAAAGLALPAKSEIALAPGHDHLMLTGLTRPLKIGDRINITLTVRDDDGTVHEITVNAEVRLRSPLDDELRGHHHR